jgi:protoheme IX farnesyltransferase
MIAEKLNTHSFTLSMVSAKLRDYVQLVKMRLTLTVVFSAAMGFLLASTAAVNWGHFWILVSGGFLVVAAANGINQVIEKDYDKLMTRTANRPVATNRMSSLEASVSSMIMGLAGVVMLGHYLNPISGWLGLFAFLSYAFVYTPMKRVSPVAVFIGAFPGAIPPMLGWVAVTGRIDIMAITLFAIQFFWQFPHFWAIAWILDDDYKKAGFRLLPSYKGRDRKSAMQSVLYSLVLIPLSLLPVHLGVSGNIAGGVVLAASILFTWQSYRLYLSCDMKDAKRLMFASFIYLPIVLLAYFIDKL